MDFWKNPRARRGLEIAALGMVRREATNKWSVASQTNGGARYTVTLSAKGEPACSCPDFKEAPKSCKHIHAAMFFLAVEATAGGKRPQLLPGISPTGVKSSDDAPTVVKQGKTPARRTYRQNWAAYNQAQKSEREFFTRLLDPLCAGVTQPPQENGRPRLALRDIVYSAAMKVYLGMSGRRSSCDMRELALRGHMETAPSYNSISRYLDNRELTPVIQRLIAESAAPLKAFELAFAVDGTGFSSSTYRSWFDHRFGRMKFETDWVKANVLVGATTHIVVQATVIRGEAEGSNDGAHILPLAAGAVTQGWSLKEVSADMAYLSAPNLHGLAALGAQPYIPFKQGTAYGGRKGNSGDIWVRMGQYFLDHREEFLTHYHKRSNVEAAIRMIKAKFGPYVRSKTEAAQVNEVLLKILGHNICCLIQAIFEFKLEPVFWTDQTTPPPSSGKETL